MQLKSSVALLAIACVLLTSPGCGKSKGNVSGKVTLEGKAVRSGSVTMAGDDGVTVQAEIQPDGTYIVKGVSFGKVSVAVNSPDPNPAEPFADAPEGFKHPMLKGKEMPKSAGIGNAGWFPIPGDYGRPGQSGISFILDQKEMTFDIKMKEKEATPAP